MNNSTKSLFGGCSSPIADVGSFGWPAVDVVDVKGRSTSISDSSLAFQKPESDGGSCGGGGGGGVFIDSTPPIMDFGISSSTTSDWNPSYRENCNSMIQQEAIMDSSQIQKDWSPGDNISSTADFLLNTVTSSGNTTASYPVCSATSVLLQSLFESDDHDPQPPQQQQLFNNRSMNYMSSSDDQLSSSPSWPQIFKPSLPKQPPSAAAGLHFSNNAPFWNPSSTVTSDGTTFLPSSSQPQFLLPTFEEKSSKRSSLVTKVNTEEVRDSGSGMKKESNEPAFKRPRIETPSPLPTFKVRKEKLGDRITALQQLVSPFGKTDTASVLHEAIEYIKFLHDQVNVLSTPYMKQGQGAPNNIQHQQGIDNSKDLEGSKQDLRSRGLCLVPISSTFPVANHTTADFWTPTFGGTFR